VLRGDGNGNSDLKSNYEYLIGIQTTDQVAMKLVGAGSIFSIFGNQNGRKAEGGALDVDEIGYRKLKIELIPNTAKTGFIINVWITEGANIKGLVHHLIKNYSYIPTEGIPLDLKYGFAANNRNMTSTYEIRNLEIEIPDSDLPLPTLTTSSLDESVTPEATNLITPNGDGINDNWIIRDIEYFGNNSIRILNRFGQEVYRKKNYLNDWDGTKDGTPLPKGTYYYIFENSKTKQPLKGYITIF
jgi:gliding motility-associated-like protein